MLPHQDLAARVVAAAASGAFDLTSSESPEFIGRVIARFSNADLLKLSGRALVATSFAAELSVTDIDGCTSRTLTIAEE